MTKYHLEHFWEWIKERKGANNGIGFMLYDTQAQFLAALAKKKPAEQDLKKVLIWFLNSELSNYKKVYERSEWQQAQAWKRSVDEEQHNIQEWKVVNSKIRLKSWEFWLIIKKKIKLTVPNQLNLIKSKLQAWTKLLRNRLIYD